MLVSTRASTGLRCAYCHGHLREAEARCARCRTHLHADCRAALTRCPTLGCGALTPAPDPPAPDPPAPDPPAPDPPDPDQPRLRWWHELIPLGVAATVCASAAPVGYFGVEAGNGSFELGLLTLVEQVLLMGFLFVISAAAGYLRRSSTVGSALAIVILTGSLLVGFVGSWTLGVCAGREAWELTVLAPRAAEIRAAAEAARGRDTHVAGIRVQRVSHRRQSTVLWLHVDSFGAVGLWVAHVDHLEPPVGSQPTWAEGIHWISP